MSHRHQRAGSAHAQRGRLPSARRRGHLLTWCSEAAQRLLTGVRVGMVRADPQVVPEVPVRGEVAYYQLHGSPRIYHSEYSEPYLDALARELSAHQRVGRRTWCIFDNTASFAAVPNALSLLRR
ncbi:DUF72 domain-containing protein [Cystobacter fuscus]